MEFHTTYSENNYTIYVNNGILKETLLKYTNQYEQVFYIIDSHVYDLHEKKFKDFNNVIKVPRGESFKTIENTMSVIDELLDQNVKRNDLMVVIGGGATGDGGAFVSSITLRGLDYIHVPTTLLAHDSAIGGKTAINRKQGKNLVGTFYRPNAVIYDLDFLETLPEEEVLSGFGEVIKHAMLDGQESIDALLEKTKNGVDIKNLNAFILNGIRTKMYYVSVDEKEDNLRKFLNLGHTLGHALEYAFKLKHGAAVVLGIIGALYISNKRYDDTFDIKSFINYVKHIGYDLSPLKNMNATEMIRYMSSDKKNMRKSYIGYVVLREFGQPELIEISTSDLETLLNELKAIV
ncbi:3-dehydroquinate synthase family protein [Phocicoccus pinnipedialis]|uniref:3-dehydroquinate synthase n=1 Tax=Phocicoccus pinnipedialis TaxID=110845 RepID=A0A6V7RF69_9BACL|nr:3-dehydroquinate synthase family protein [Jeotgalicoccus pinnipedialis]MBP1939369.1 3-dehydroquinate synthase [Jeotgalicoccus pinnipedialis]CAD2075652.1 3-dehydroquinate synthase [Jeotgalicoccus pinnipedialis]